MTTEMQVRPADSSSYGQQATSCSNRKQGPCSQRRTLCIGCDSTLVISMTCALHRPIITVFVPQRDVGLASSTFRIGHYNLCHSAVGVGRCLLSRRALASSASCSQVLATHNGSVWDASTVSCRGKCEGTSRVNKPALQPRLFKNITCFSWQSSLCLARAITATKLLPDSGALDKCMHGALSYWGFCQQSNLSYHGRQDPMDNSLVKELLLGAPLITLLHLYVVSAAEVMFGLRRLANTGQTMTH